MFDLCSYDLDGNGELDAEELEAMSREELMRAAAVATKQHMAAMDNNHDGVVDR